MLHSRRSVLVFALLGMLILGGCRSYGGYDTKPNTYEAMQKAVQSFENELNRAKADLRTLEEAATQADALQSLATQFQAHIDEHSTLLEMQHDRVQRLSPDAAYRTLSRAYGATVTEQRMMQKKYQRVIRSVAAAVQGPEAQPPSGAMDRKYTIHPANFPTAGDDATLTWPRLFGGFRRR